MKELCFFACSEQFHLQDGACAMVALMRGLSQKLGVVLTNLDFTYTNGDIENEIESTFSDNSLEQLQFSLKEYLVSQIAIWSAAANSSGPPNFKLYSELVEVKSVPGYKYVYIQFPLEKIADLNPTAFLQFVTGLLSSVNAIGRLDYALVTTMDEDAYPSIYFRGILTGGLTEAEATDLVTWERKKSERKIKLRGLYWGNLLSHKHLAQTKEKQIFINRLQAILGQDSITSINGDDVFFMLPTSDIITDHVADSIRSLLNDYELLMHPDDEVRNTVSNVISQLLTRPRQQLPPNQ